MTLAAEVREITSRAEWLAWRRTCITASRVASLFDEHPFLTRADLATELRGDSQGDKPSMRAGRILEPGVAVALGEDNPDWQIVKARTFHVDAVARFGATPDYWLDDDGLIQVKTASPETWEQWHGKPPLAYSLQTLSEMMLTGRVRGVLAVMIRSRSYPVYTFEVPRHEAAEARILAAVAEWWRAWDTGEIAPPADADGLDQMLDDGSVCDLSSDNQIRYLLDERERLKSDTGIAEKRLTQIDEYIKARIGAARSAWLPGWQLSWPTIHGKAYSVPARDYRRLTIKRTEE